MAATLVATTNGKVSRSDVIRLGDTQAKKIPYELNGRPMLAWDLTSERYPSSVGAELDDARNAYLSAQKRVDEDDLPVNPQLVRAARTILEQVAGADVKTLAEDGRLQAMLGELDSAVKALDASRVRVSQHAWEIYVTRCLMAVMPGLEEGEADMLGKDRMRILVNVGLFARNMLPPEDLQGDEETDESRGQSGQIPLQEDVLPETGAKPAQDSPDSTE